MGLNISETSYRYEAGGSPRLKRLRIGWFARPTTTVTGNVVCANSTDQRRYCFPGNPPLLQSAYQGLKIEPSNLAGFMCGKPLLGKPSALQNGSLNHVEVGQGTGKGDYHPGIFQLS